MKWEQCKVDKNDPHCECFWLRMLLAWMFIGYYVKFVEAFLRMYCIFATKFLSFVKPLKPIRILPEDVYASQHNPALFKLTRPRTIKNIDRNALFGTVKIQVNGIFILFNSVLFFELTYVLRKGYSTSRKKQWFEHDWNDRASRNIVPKLKTFVLWFNWECCQRNIASTVLFDSVAFRECRWWHIALPL